MSQLQNSISRVLSVRLIPSPLGELVAMADVGGIVALNFVKENDSPEAVAKKWADKFDMDWKEKDHFSFDQLESELEEYFSGDRQSFSVPVHLKGTSFQKDVWQELLKIPFGDTRTYGGIADILQIKHGSRAVGKANGDNPIAILVPCHRVIGADGDLTGYAGGKWRKQKLLALESGQPQLF